MDTKEFALKKIYEDPDIGNLEQDPLKRELYVPPGSEEICPNISALSDKFEQMNVAATIGGGFRPQGLTNNEQQRVLAVAKTLVGSILRYSYSKALLVNAEQHICFKRPDGALQRANLAMKKDSLVITVDIDPVEED